MGDGGMRLQVLASWQTHGAKLEAVRAEFQTDAQSIRDILRLWQRHGHQINAFLESGEAGTLQNGTKGLPDVNAKGNGVKSPPATHQLPSPPCINEQRSGRPPSKVDHHHEATPAGFLLASTTACLRADQAGQSVCECV